MLSLVLVLLFQWHVPISNEKINSIPCTLSYMGPDPNDFKFFFGSKFDYSSDLNSDCMVVLYAESSPGTFISMACPHF